MIDSTQIKIGFACPKTGRVAVALSEYAQSEFNVETNSYMYSVSSDELGFDQWATIDSIDIPVEGNSFDIWFSSGSCKQNVPSDTVIFVRASIAQTLKDART